MLPFRVPHLYFRVASLNSKLCVWLIACPLALGRYLILLDKFLEDLSPQEIEAVTIPTLDEVRTAMDAQGTQWVQQALAIVPGKCRQVLWIPTYSKFHIIDLLVHCVNRASPLLSSPVHLQVYERTRVQARTRCSMRRATRPARAWTKPRLSGRNLRL